MAEWKKAQITFWYKGDRDSFQADLGRMVDLTKSQSPVTDYRAELDGTLVVWLPLHHIDSG